ncbi:transcriptional regulator [Marinifilum breve]|uniref:Transcriptional regulator n=1 Tax=Marinifilum breve TaxID=2184082 RepID=A0A2V4A0P6_9BACT|nr:TenA family protein [Marinifilum breve]PXY02455.1 transcriptional regulator [Marinifilum breve]
MQAVGTFTKELWEAAFPVYQELISCRFVTGLAAGTLSKESFSHYLTQDILYLKMDAEALGRVAVRSKNDEDKDFFKSLEMDGLEVEFVLRDEYLRHFNLQEARVQSKAFADYSTFLLNHAKNSPLEVAYAALLPCFWIYGAVADTIIQKNVSNNPYQKFIDTYAGDEYQCYTQKFIEIVECNSIESEYKEQVKEAFVQACKHELAVFEESYDI